MKIGIGLPNIIPNISGNTILEWTLISEKLGFSKIATIDRVAYPSFDTLVSLSAAAAVTKKINLQTNILLAPIRNSILLAKEVASLSQLSNGRFTLGLGVGSREDDYLIVGKQFKKRGESLNQTLDILSKVWSGEKLENINKTITPFLTFKTPIVFGGMSIQTVERIVRWGEGWTASGVDVENISSFIDKVKEEWKLHNCQGSPKIIVQAYFAIGNNARKKGEEFLLNYYSYLGKYSTKVASQICSTKSDIIQLVSKFEKIGANEVIFFPAIGDLNQVANLAKIIL